MSRFGASLIDLPLYALVAKVVLPLASRLILLLDQAFPIMLAVFLCRALNRPPGGR